VADGNVWTSSGVSAGIDMMLAFVRDIHGKDVAAGIAQEIEYVWDVEEDGTRDPFAFAAV
jgi:transcriptional regulator GlxA family with amidase domain